MDMIRFCMAIAACVIVPIIMTLISDRCHVRKKARDLLLGGFAIVALPILTYFNLALFSEIIWLNEDLTEAELDQPKESRFLSLLFLLVAFMIITSAVIFTCSCCCYCCCLAAYFDAVRRYRRNPEDRQRPEQVIDPNLDPADRAAIEAALRDLDRAQDLPDLVSDTTA